MIATLLKNWRLVSVVALLVVLVAIIGVCLWSVSHYAQRAVTAEGRAEQLQSDNDLQATTLASQALTFHRMNQIADNTLSYQIGVAAKSEEAQIEIRTIIKREPASVQCIDSGVAERLLKYTYSLRASAMSTAAGKLGSADTATTATACRLTYAQAVYWITPLLETIDKLNSQLVGIQKADASRVQVGN